jgi:hypothetical protein
MFKTPKAIGWICAAVGAVMLAGTATASAGDGFVHVGGRLQGAPGCMIGSTDCWVGSGGHRAEGGRSYRRDDHRRDNYRRNDHRRDDHRRGKHRYKHRDRGPDVGIYLGVPSYRYVEPRRIQPRVSLSRAHVNWCHNRYRSYRAWDNSFQPYNGPRKQCWSPYS